MRKFRIGGVCLLTLAAAACASSVSTPESLRAERTTSSKTEATSFEAVKTATVFFHDEHVGGRTATGPEIRYLDPNRNKLLDGYAIYRFIGIDVGRSGVGVVDFSDVQIRVKQSTYGDWPTYNAAFSFGKALPLTRIDQEVSCGGASCLKTEIVGIDLTMPNLREMAEKPILAFKIVGKRNSMLIEIPQSYVQGFLAAIDEAETNSASLK